MSSSLTPNQATTASPIIVVDGLFFQFAATGIARVWRSYFEQWADTGFARHVVVLDRDKTAPRVPGIRYHDVPRFDYFDLSREMLRLEDWCRELRADVFISTFYSTPVETRSVMMVHDMIYEVLLGGAKNDWEQEEKALSILHASRFVAVSQNTARDLHHFHPEISANDVAVIPNAVDACFQPPAPHVVTAVKEKFNLGKPYFLLVGTRIGFQGYKNAVFLPRALSGMPIASEVEIVCVGGEITLSAVKDFKGVSVRLLAHVSEEDLIALYGGAEALVYPSRYEGFGLPILEAMACGCPVITCPNGSLPEVAGDAALFVENDDDAGLASALIQVRKPAQRERLSKMGRQRAAHFSWKQSADLLAETLLSTAALQPRLEPENRLWRALRERETRVAALIKAARHAPRRRLRLGVGNYQVEVNASRRRPVS